MTRENTMNIKAKIAEQAIFLGYELAEEDINIIKQKYFHLLVNKPDNIRQIRSILKDYFS